MQEDDEHFEGDCGYVSNAEREMAEAMACRGANGAPATTMTATTESRDVFATRFVGALLACIAASRQFGQSFDACALLDSNEDATRQLRAAFLASHAAFAAAPCEEAERAFCEWRTLGRVLSGASGDPDGSRRREFAEWRTSDVVPALLPLPSDLADKNATIAEFVAAWKAHGAAYAQHAAAETNLDMLQARAARALASVDAPITRASADALRRILGCCCCCQGDGTCCCRVVLQDGDPDGGDASLPNGASARRLCARALSFGLCSATTLYVANRCGRRSGCPHRSSGAERKDGEPPRVFFVLREREATAVAGTVDVERGTVIVRADVAPLLRAASPFGLPRRCSLMVHSNSANLPPPPDEEILLRVARGVIATADAEAAALALAIDTFGRDPATYVGATECVVDSCCRAARADGEDRREIERGMARARDAIAASLADDCRHKKKIVC